MAAIGSIRKQSGLLIVIIGVAMVLFLLGDFFSSGGSSFLSNQEQEVGMIAGDPISLQEYELRVQQAIDEQYGTQGANERARKSIRDRVWNQMIQERTVYNQLDELGVSVSPDELLDQVKNVRPGSVLYQYFTDPQTGQVIEQFRDPQTGGMNSQMVLQAIQNLLQSDNSKDWLPIERAISQDVLMNKYLTLIQKGMMSTSVEANQVLTEQSNTVTFSYAVKEFSSIENEAIEVADADLMSYYNSISHEERFESDQESRTLKYVFFSVEPTEEDLAEIRLELEDIKAEFETDSNDTAFVAENAETQFSQLIAYTPEVGINPTIKDSVLVSEIGTVFGPYDQGNRSMISKLIGIKSIPDSVKASHILISFTEGDTAAQSAAEAKIDSIKAAANSGNFAELAKKHSDDFGSAEKGGDLDWFTKGRMVAPFEKAAFEGEVGDMPVVVSQFGVHLIYITDQTEDRNQYLLASVDRELIPSKSTSDNIYKLASKYSIDNKGSELVGEEGKLRVEEAEVRLTDNFLGQVADSREVIKWAFDQDAGEVSSPFELEKGFVVARLERVNEKGVMSLETVKRIVELEYIDAKKAEQIQSELGSFTSVDEAAKNMGVAVKTASNVNFAMSSLPGGLGRENLLLGTAIGMNEGEISEPIVGDRGVFVIRVDKKTDAPIEADLSVTKRQQTETYTSRVNGQVFQALRDNAGIEDTRARYY